MTDDISKVACHDCFGGGKTCLAGRNAHRTNWHDCETCAGTGHIERAAPSPSRAACQHADTRAGWDSVTCNVCGAFKADSGWGIAKGEWFKSRDEAEFYKKNGRRLESATTPAEVDVMQLQEQARAWEAVFSTLSRIQPQWHCSAPVRPSKEMACEFITTLARQLAEAKADNERLRAEVGDWNVNGPALVQQLELSKQREAHFTTQMLEARNAQQQAESQLAEATRRLGEVEGLVGKWRELGGNDSLDVYYADGLRACADELEQLTKEPTK